MAYGCRLLSSILRRRRFFSTSIPDLDSHALHSSKEKSRQLLSRIRFERNPERVIAICREAGLTPDSHLDRIAYSKAVSRLRESKDYDGIRRFISESMSQVSRMSERAASHFIVLYGKGGVIEDAVKLFDQMTDMGVERNIMTLNSLLFSCCLAEEYGEMKRIFMEFPRRYGLVPNLDTYNIVLKGFCESGSANMAHSILAEMERKCVKPDKTTFSFAIEGFYREESFTDVGKIMSLMKKYDVHPGISIYNVRIQNLCKLKRSSEAKALLDGILSRNMKPNCVTYGHLIHGFCREGKLDMAKSLYKEMLSMDLKPESECYFTLIHYLCRGGDFGAALKICKECIATDKYPNITTMTSLVRGLASTGKVADAREIIKQVKGKFSRNADSWSKLEDELPK